MIHFSKSGTQIKASVEYRTFQHKSYMFFYWEAGSDLASDALSIALQEQLEKSVNKAVKDAYEQGWIDAKAKKQKQSWFSSVIKHFRN